MAASAAIGAAITARSPAAPDIAITSLKLWCMVHGLSHLILDGMLAGYDPDKLAQAITSGLAA